MRDSATPVSKQQRDYGHNWTRNEQSQADYDDLDLDNQLCLGEILSRIAIQVI